MSLSPMRALLPRQAPDEVAGLSASSMASLEQAGDRHVDFTTIATFSVSILAMWFLIYVSAAFTNAMFSRFTKTYARSGYSMILFTPPDCFYSQISDTIL